MNNIAVALVIFMLLFKKDNNYKQILSSLSSSDIQTLLDFFGINENLKNTIINLVPSFLDGNFDFQNIIKSLLPLLISTFSSNQAQQNAPTQDCFYELDGVASEQIKQNLKDYFT